MQKKLATGMVLACVCASAMGESREPGFYVGLGAGQVTLKDNIAGVSIKARDTGYKAFAGYRFNEYGSLEASYSAGTPNDTVMGFYVESDASAFQASALWQIPISARFEGYVRFSVIAWETENTATNGSIRFRQENDGTDPAFGIGGALHVTQHLGLRAEIEGAELDGTDLRLLTMSAVYRF